MDTELLLKNRRVLVTRPREQSQPLARALESLGAEVILIPAIEIVPPEDWFLTDQILGGLGSYDWIVFTSANGVAGFLGRFDQIVNSRELLRGLKVAVVGAATRSRAEAAGLEVRLQPAGGTVEDLATELVRSYDSEADLDGLRMLVPTSNIGRDVFRNIMLGYGCVVDVIEVYRTMPARLSADELDELQAGRVDDIVFASPSAVASLTQALASANLTKVLNSVRVTCIGRVTADAAKAHGLVVQCIADEPSVESIIEAMTGPSREKTE